MRAVVKNVCSAKLASGENDDSLTAAAVSGHPEFGQESAISFTLKGFIAMPFTPP